MEELFGNLWILFLLLGFLGLGRRGGRSTRRQEPFGGAGRARTPETVRTGRTVERENPVGGDLFNWEQPAWVEETVGGEETVRAAESVRVEEPVQAEGAAWSEAQTDAATPEEVPRAARRARSTAESRLRQVARQDWATGIILSEVLGAPRALRPWRPGRSR